MVMTHADSTTGFDATYTVQRTTGKQSSNDCPNRDIDIVAHVIRRAIDVQGIETPN